MKKKKNNCFILIGLSGSGKTTLARKIKKKIPYIVWIDGDEFRKGLSSDLDYSYNDREENVRRLKEVIKLFMANGKSVIVSFIFPFECSRMAIKREIGNCYIIFCNSSLQKCEERDCKGLYKKARSGQIENFTGFTSPFDTVESTDLILNTELSFKKSYQILLTFIKNKEKIK